MSERESEGICSLLTNGEHSICLLKRRGEKHESRKYISREKTSDIL